ncbi:response regulator transcription factor [Magnetospirillum molischianum]|uniref:Two component response transcriptional regulatory protein, LuxR family n=1 Tax=Magnetospirillum molischianum DSM 120 TaxID=1150626 RepID=H8FRN3_MAGML|nr:response regulator [Magnetospirillum molischianum]CCG41021.1 Two component response transcriptional regulatory protein, LuxR family [Magnetospirillum molischianum DSM 120]
MSGSVVFIVDDDEAIRDALSWLFQSRGVAVETFASAEAFLAMWHPGRYGCVVLDIRMDGMTGIELFDRLRETGTGLPVIFLTGHGDVPMAVAAVKKGARDFVEKPFNDNDLVDRVIEALDWADQQRESDAAGAYLAARLDTLTLRERQVMERVLAGKLNKVIADELGITMRTVEVHRARLFEKMGVKTAVELAQTLAAPKRSQP